MYKYFRNICAYAHSIFGNEYRTVYTCAYTFKFFITIVYIDIPYEIRAEFYERDNVMVK